MAGSIRNLVRATAVLLTLAGGAATTAGAAAATTLRVAGSADVSRAAVLLAPPAPPTRLHVTFTLTPRNPGALSAYAQAVTDPSSRLYRHYLTPRQFGQRFGASPAHIRAVRAWLRARGLIPGPTSAGALSIPVAGASTALERGLRISLRRVRLRGGRVAMAAASAPAAPAQIAADVISVVGLDTVAARHPLFARAPRLRAARARAAAVSAVNTGGPSACGQARSTASSQGAYTADQIASAYGFSGLYGAHDLGAGTTVAMYELEPVSPADISAYESCYKIHTSVNGVAVDGGAGSGDGSGEAALDVENLIGLAPDVNVLVYQGPNSNSGSPGSGPYDTFSAIINQDRARVISISWGECEAALGATDARAENTLFAQASIEGQTLVSAAGDNGSEDCSGSTIPSASLSVDDPASQPFVTGVGGTTLSSLGPPPSESVWNDGTALGGLHQPGAGGGGISSLWAMPTAQRDAASSLGVLAAGTTGSQCGASSGYCREVPDVAADANPSTGYVIYWNGDGSVPGEPQGWQSIGGTSGGAPLWAAVIALADASSACAQGPVGDALPALYRAASDGYAADFNDVTTGNNDFTGTNGGHYAAGAGYDEASGLGTPNAAALAPVLCTHSIHLQAPATEHSAAHAAIEVPVQASDIAGATVVYSAQGLPAGLTIAPFTGVITGSARRAGTYTATIIARDTLGSTASSHLIWTVGAATRLTAVKAVRRGRHAPVLTFRLTAGAGSPALRRLQVGMPAFLRLASTRGIRIVSGRRRAGAKLIISNGVLTALLIRSARSVTVDFGRPGLKTVGGKQGRARGRAAALVLVVTDTQAGISQLRAQPRTTRAIP